MPLAQHCLYAGDVAAYLPHSTSILKLAICTLEAQVEALSAEGVELLGQLIVGLRPHIRCFHQTISSPWRITKRVPIGSLAAARANASRAIVGETPSRSNMMRPGLIRHPQNSGDPLPLPMRTSAGFCDTGTSGKIRIQTRPARRIWRVIARRAASIWRAETRPGSAALSPKAPKFSVDPPLARPQTRPLCALRCLLRFGLSRAASIRRFAAASLVARRLS